MWTLLTGYLLSIFFKFQIIELFKNQFSNETLSFGGILLGWFFQEYTREEFEFTSGKRFMLERDFRNRLFTQSFKIFRNLIIYPHLITTLELGTFLLLFGGGAIVLIKIHWPKFIKYKNKITELVNNVGFRNTKNYENFLNKTFIFLYTHWGLKFNDIILFFSLGFIFKYGFLKTYFWYDTMFIFRPIFFLIFITFGLFSFVYINFIVYLYVLHNFSKNLALLLKLLTTKLIFSTITVGFYLVLFFNDLNVQNLTTENFFKEVFFKNFIIFYQIICLKQN